MSTYSASISQGTVAPGFEPVREKFDAMLRSGCDTRAQLCVICGGERVVDLWGTAPKIVDEDFGPDSLVNVFSSTKTITAIVVAKMVDQGRLSYDALVTDYWPEFGANGKEELTVADILRHEGGLTKFDTSIAPEDLTTQRIKENAVGAVIEKQSLEYREGGPQQRREYHAITRGWILNEIVRRVDKQGRTVGEILRSDICDPLGGIDAFIGLPTSELKRALNVEKASLGYLTKQSLTPAIFGREIDMNFLEMVGRMKMIKTMMKTASRQGFPPELKGLKWGNTEEVFNAEKTRMTQIPSANGHASARGLASLASLMVADTTSSSSRLLSASTLESFHSEPTEKDILPEFPCFMTKGGVSLDRPPTIPPANPLPPKFKCEGIEGSYGWIGYGGSVIQWHPETKIGFGFVPTFMYVMDMQNLRGKRLLAEAIRCAKLRL